MRVGLIGRSELLLETAKNIMKSDHKICFIYTCKDEDYYLAKESDFESFCRVNNIPFFNSIKIVDDLQNLKNYNVDLCLSVNWLTVLPDFFLAAFKGDIFNAHVGALPRYKGNACPNWAILNFEKSVSITIHKMSAALDEGPILFSQEYNINEQTYITEIYEWMRKIIPALFLQTLNHFKEGTINYIHHNELIRPLRTFPRKPSDAKIKWNRSTKAILALIRASSRPFCGAFCYTEKSQKVVIFKAKLFAPDYDFLAIPGQLCEINNMHPVIATKDGMIELEEYQVEDYSFEESQKILCKSLRARLL